MADVCFGATLRFMTLFKMLPSSEPVAAYIDRLQARPAFQRMQERSQAAGA